MKLGYAVTPKRKQSQTTAAPAAIATEGVVLRGLQAGQVHMTSRAEFDRSEALRAIKSIKRIAAKYEPSKKHGATVAVREQRNRGE